jgi:hypothetical protein
LLSVPHEKSAFGYNISTAVFASLDSIAAGAKFRCCTALADRDAVFRRLAHEMLRKRPAIRGWARRWLPGFRARSQLASSAHERIE